jgi:tetratricopeptide (TPR) repeat protein
MNQVLAAHASGLGHMERYEYRAAAGEFREVVRLAPDWLPAKINLAIALLNDTGAKAEQAKSQGGKAEPTNFEEALTVLGEVLAREPGNLHANYCKGLILEYLGNAAEAHEAYRKVTEKEPTSGHAWLKFGATLPDPARPTFPAGPKQAQQLIEIYTKALQCNPYLVQAMSKLQQAYIWAGDREKAKEINQLWEKLNPERTVTGSGDVTKLVYGEMGPYAEVINPVKAVERASATVAPPRFDPPQLLQVQLGAGERWVARSDFTGDLEPLGRIRDRLGAAIVVWDADGDGMLDLFLPAAVKTAEGVRDAVLVNKGDGRFEDATARLGFPTDAPSHGAAAADCDADGRVDLFLLRLAGNRLLRSMADQPFEDATGSLGAGSNDAVTLAARWLDLDQDGDLDLYLVNYCSRDQAQAVFTSTPPEGVANRAFRNDGVPPEVPGRPPGNWAPVAVAPPDLTTKGGLSLAFSDWTAPGQDGKASPALALAAGQGRHLDVAALDVDQDRDIDLVVSTDGEPPRMILNDRLGRFHEHAYDGWNDQTGFSGLVVTDLDADGRADLAANDSGQRSSAFRSVARPLGQPGLPGFGFEYWFTDARQWRSALVADLDLDGRLDLLGLPAAGADPSAPLWSINEGNKLSTRVLALGPGATTQLQGLAYAPLRPDALPSLILWHDGEPPRVANNLGNGNRWLALDLYGRWKEGNDKGPMRSNVHGLGTRITLDGPGLNVSYIHSTSQSGPAQSVSPIVLGLGKNDVVPMVRLRWPDGVMQCELNAGVDQLLVLAENCRKTGSCPVLFTYDGERFVCLGDFLGGGGLGYLLAPGVISQPDRDESMLIRGDQLRPERGAFRLAITEPMDEVAYLDQVVLDVVDAPPGLEVGLDERFSPGTRRPTGSVIAWRERIDPVRAWDHRQRDVTGVLRAFDRTTASGFLRRVKWVGYAEPHAIVLDFGDRLQSIGQDQKLALVLAGWVEYPYSQTNYAAATAGVPLEPPVVERQMPDGSWAVIESEPGYPAGLPRRMSVEITGKLGGEPCVLRIRTNMECYWDEAFLAVLEPTTEVRVTSLNPARAKLHYRGYTREVSPDGKLPLLYDYDYVDPVPLERLEGRLTRFGDVRPLLLQDDDQLCVMGPGDEVQLEFDAEHLPALPEGWSRSYVLRSIGYCKDADPATVTSDTIGPLPWKGMPDYPFGAEGERPRDAEYQKYLETYQTRRVGAERSESAP